DRDRESETAPVPSARPRSRTAAEPPSLLTDPWRVRIRRATGHLHAAAAQLDDKEDVEPYMDSSRWSNERSMRWRTQSYRCGRISGLLMDALRRPATMDSRDIRGQSLQRCRRTKTLLGLA